jgi:hypothetical protein
MPRRAFAALALLAAVACGAPPERESPALDAGARRPGPAPGTPKTGPGARFNACERIWCLEHGSNFALSHFLEGHVGWILHDDAHGDVFSPRGRAGGPQLPDARTAMLRLCGAHVHPWILERGKGAIRRGGWNAALGYGRKHFTAYGTRLEPCCTNGLGWGFLHASTPAQFRFHDVKLYREAPGIGWQNPHRPASGGS